MTGIGENAPCFVVENSGKYQARVAICRESQSESVDVGILDLANLTKDTLLAWPSSAVRIFYSIYPRLLFFSSQTVLKDREVARDWKLFGNTLPLRRYI